MHERLPAPRTARLTTSFFLLALVVACSAGGRGPSGGGDTGGAGGDEPEDTGGRSGHPAPDAAAPGKVGTGGSMGAGGLDDTGGSMGTGGREGTGGRGGSGGAMGRDAGGDASSGDAGAAPTFSEVYARIMSQTPEVPVSSCQTGPCHGSPGTAKAIAKIDMTTKERAWVGVMKLVVPRNPAGSKLYTELNTGGMPEKKPKLPATLIKLVADWIRAGAMNN
jgi:hypothetical protein